MFLSFHYFLEKNMLKNTYFIYSWFYIESLIIGTNIMLSIGSTIDLVEPFFIIMHIKWKVNKNIILVEMLKQSLKLSCHKHFMDHSQIIALYFRNRNIFFFISLSRIQCNNLALYSKYLVTLTMHYRNAVGNAMWQPSLKA